MASSRMIREGILTSERVNALNWESEVFYRRLLSIGDDFGLFDARPAILRSSLYPLKIDHMREINITRCLAACEEAGLVRLYEVDKKPYGMIVDYGQRIRKESVPKYPINEEISEIIQLSPESRGEARRDAAECGSSPPKTETKTETKTNNKSLPVNQTSNLPFVEELKPKARSSQCVPPPGTVSEVEKYMLTLQVRPSGEELSRCANKFFDNSEAVDWVTKDGIPIRDWRAQARSYAATWARSSATNGVRKGDDGMGVKWK